MAQNPQKRKRPGGLKENNCGPLCDTSTLRISMLPFDHTAHRALEGDDL